MTDVSGAVSYTAAYSPYGERLGSQGSAVTPYGFTGEWEDSYIKLIYLRSRYYSPATGKFLTRDSWQGDYNRPLSLNRWAYVEGNPINYSDPTGNNPHFEDLPDRRDLTDWLPRAAVYMASDPAILEIKRLNLTQRTDQTIIAAFRFYNLVRDGARFDVKDEMLDTVGPIIKLGDYWYEYTTAGNILYGFYGLAAGYNEEILHKGAGYAQATDLFRWLWAIAWCGDETQTFPDIGGPAHYYDTPEDDYAIDFGIWLYRRYYEPAGSFPLENLIEGLQIYEFSWGLHRVLDPGDYIPNTTGPYAPNEFDHE